MDANDGKGSDTVKTLLFSMTFVAAVIAMVGCTPPTLNPERTRGLQKDEYRYQVIQDNANRKLNDIFLATTFSGGGMRAAALAYGALQAMRESTVTAFAPGEEGSVQPIEVPLIHEIDFVSSVSGGSVTAAYWALHGPDRLDGLRDKFFDKNIQGQLWASVLSPSSLLLLPTAMRSRIDLLSENFDKNLFDKGSAESKTYEDLIEIVKNEEHRPYMVINATDMSTGSLFPFIQLQFDLLCSDLNQVKIADAVAASAAYPVFLSALTLTNYRPDVSCLDQAAEQEESLQAELDAKRMFVSELRKELDGAEERMKNRQDELGQAEDDVRRRELQVQRADERVQVGQAELQQADEQVNEIQEGLRQAEREVVRLGDELKRAQQQQRMSRQERNNVLRIELQKKNEREAEAGQVIEEIRNLTEQLENVQGDAKREGAIRRIKDWFISAVVQSDIETDTGEGMPEEVGDPSAEQTPSIDDSTELEEEPPDQTQTPWRFLELGRELRSRLYSVFVSEPQNQSQEPIEDSVEEAEPESPEPDDGGIQEATGSNDESDPTLSRVQKQLQELRNGLLDLDERIETLSEWRQESATDELSGIEDVTTRHGELKRRLDRVETGLQSLQQDSGPIDQGAAGEEKEPSSASEIVQVVAELEGIRDALATQNAELDDLEDEQVSLKLNSIVKEVLENIKEAETRLEVLKAAHVQEEREGQEIVEGKKRELEHANKQVNVLRGKLTKAEMFFAKLREANERLVKEKIRREKQLEDANRKADSERDALRFEEGLVRERERDLRRARLEVEEWERYLERIRTLQREHDMAARYYRAQITHYGNKLTEYVHLFDGGTADNLGFTPLLELLDTFFPVDPKDGEIPEWKRDTKRIGIISVDARTSPGEDYETRQASPNMLKTLITTVGTAIDSKSFLLGRELRRVTEELEDDGIIEERYIVEVSFDKIMDFHTHAGAHVHLHDDGSGLDGHIHAHDPEDRDRQLEHERAHAAPEYEELQNCERQFRQIPTSWNLSEDEILALIAMGEALVRDSQTYRRLIGKYAGKVPPSEKTVAAVCAEHLPKLVNDRSQITAAEASDP